MFSDQDIVKLPVAQLLNKFLSHFIGVHTLTPCFSKCLFLLRLPDQNSVYNYYFARWPFLAFRRTKPLCAEGHDLATGPSLHSCCLWAVSQHFEKFINNQCFSCYVVCIACGEAKQQLKYCAFCNVRVAVAVTPIVQGQLHIAVTTCCDATRSNARRKEVQSN
jgi:hypothetical protein